MKPFSAANRPERPAAETARHSPPRAPGYEIRGVRLRRGGTTVLDGLAADIPGGACTVLTGPSGAGKSALLRLLIRLDDPDIGRITFDGMDLTAHDVLALRRRVQLVAQRPVLLTGSVLSEVRIARPDLTETQVETLLVRAGLPARFLARSTRGLSGGEAARLCVARALATNPQVLLADEPTAALDDTSTRALEHTLSEFTTGGGTLVLVSHDSAQIGRLAGQVITLDHGRRTTGEHS
ncbi:ABC transporter ATP-binding protein [Nocardia carnea]|uniref:ABC transporter ATP-binding protein n=1 Tax=Nocardia carnea TaxID=37328 RepID=UPI002456CEDF|nr:ATP-binding cassette domain-containing protein [Nocardia carnea]